MALYVLGGYDPRRADRRACPPSRGAESAKRDRPSTDSNGERPQPRGAESAKRDRPSTDSNGERPQPRGEAPPGGRGGNPLARKIKMKF
jgi:hypothetical protein